MADTKISALTALASASSDDLIPIVDDPGGTPVTKKITVANLIGGKLDSSFLGIGSLTDPNADALLGWDDTDGALKNITIGSGLTYTHASHTLSASAGSGDVTAASNFGTDNVLIRSDGTGKGVQASNIVVGDDDSIDMGVNGILSGAKFQVSGGGNQVELEDSVSDLTITAVANGINLVTAGGSLGVDAVGTTNATRINSRIVPRVGTTTSSATPSINTDAVDAYSITALAAAITSFTTNLSGTPNDFDRLLIRIKDNGTARAITWGSSFEAKGVALPTTTVISKVLTVGFIYDSVTAKWGCVAVAQEA